MLRQEATAMDHSDHEPERFSLFSWLVYYACKPLINRGGRESDIPSNYFEMEVEKSQRFDDSFSIQLGGKTVLEIGSNVGGYLCHALNHGAQFVYGIEIDAVKANRARSLLKDNYDGDNYEVIAADARDLYMIKDKSIDIVVSDAVLEHVENVDKLFSEVARILRPNGRACLATSPIWFTSNGGHLRRYIPIPWVHNVLPDRTIIEVLRIQKIRNDFPEEACANIIGLYETIGKLSLHRIRRVTANSNLKIESLRNVSRSRIRRFLIRFPVLEELFAGGIKISLRRT